MNRMLYEKALADASENELNNVTCNLLHVLKGKSAQQILDECDQREDTSVNLDEVIKKLGIKVIPTTFEKLEEHKLFKSMGKISGLVLVNGDELGVFYNKNDTHHRQRFTIAHEIAHCCLHGDALANGYVEYRNYANSTEKREVVASTFAGELLIPKKNLDYVIERLIEPKLPSLADMFDVSVAVMKARLDYLGYSYAE